MSTENDPGDVWRCGQEPPGLAGPIRSVGYREGKIIVEPSSKKNLKAT
jgi:hypothetical protein